MVRNLGTIDRIARITAGIALLGLFGALTAPWRYLTLIGLIPLGTGLLGHCPVYRAFGWKDDGHSRAEPPLLGKPEGSFTQASSRLPRGGPRFRQ